MKFIPLDANYFNRGTAKKDCVIRALCASTMIGYKTIMKLLNKEKEFIMGVGYGISRGISRAEIDDFANRTGIIERIWGDDEYSRQLDKFGTTEEDTLGSFLENDINEIMDSHGITTDGEKRFVFLVRTPNERNSDDPHYYHATSVVWQNNEWVCVDVDTIEQIQNSIPIWLYAVKKMANPDSPIFYVNERKRIREEWKNDMRKAFSKGKGKAKPVA